jgi:formate dehydrogenase major subunit
MSDHLTRRQFLKLGGGVIGGCALTELAAMGIDPARAAAAAPPAQVKQGTQVPSVCPYCAVGCGQIITTSGGKVIDIQGNADSPINQGTLCPKGAATYQLSNNPNRWTKAKYRAPNSDHWEDISLQDAMEKIAQKYKETRDANFIEKTKVGDQEKTVNQVLAIASLGGATIDDEWNYLHQKLLRATGVVSIENQARI